MAVVCAAVMSTMLVVVPWFLWRKHANHQLDTAEFKAAYGVLYENYYRDGDSQAFLLGEPALTLRKAALVATYSLLISSTESRVTALLSLNTIFFLLNLACQPFKQRSDHFLS